MINNLTGRITIEKKALFIRDSFALSSFLFLYVPSTTERRSSNYRDN